MDLCGQTAQFTGGNPPGKGRNANLTFSSPFGKIRQVRNGPAQNQTAKKCCKKQKICLTMWKWCDRMSKLTTPAWFAAVPCKLNNAKTKWTPWTIKMDCLSVLERITANENSWVIIARSKLFKKWFELPLRKFRYNFLRVWSWLRTNAGGVPNTCKSNGVMISVIT